MELKVSKREVSGKKVAGLRKQSIVPGVIYWKNMKEPIMVQVDKNSFLKAYHKAWQSAVIQLADGAKNLVLIKELHIDPVTNNVLNVSFLDVKANQAIVASIPVVLTGESIVTKQNIWNIDLVKDSIQVEALPFDLPQEISLDISHFQGLDDWLFVRDIDLWKKVTILDDSELPVVVVTAKVEEVEEIVLETTESSESDVEKTPADEN